MMVSELSNLLQASTKNTAENKIAAFLFSLQKKNKKTNKQINRVSTELFLKFLYKKLQHFPFWITFSDNIYCINIFSAERWYQLQLQK